MGEKYKHLPRSLHIRNRLSTIKYTLGARSHPVNVKYMPQNIDHRSCYFVTAIHVRQTWIYMRAFYHPGTKLTIYKLFSWALLHHAHDSGQRLNAHTVHITLGRRIHTEPITAPCLTLHQMMWLSFLGAITEMHLVPLCLQQTYCSLVHDARRQTKKTLKSPPFLTLTL